MKPVYHANPPLGCDVCHSPIGDDLFDAKIKPTGYWGNLCRQCFEFRGVGLGTGRGQHFKRQSDGRYLKVGG